MTPFKAKMETAAFMQMAQAFKEKGKTLVECYDASETVHEAFFNQTKYSNFESFKKAYYENHPTKRG